MRTSWLLARLILLLLTTFAFPGCPTSVDDDDSGDDDDTTGDDDDATGEFLCADATPIDCAVEFALEGQTLPDPSEPSLVDDWSVGCGGPSAGNSWPGPEAVFVFEAVDNGDVTFHLTGLTADLDIYVKDAAPGGDCDLTSTCVGTSENAADNDESVTFTAVAGTTYYAFVDGANSATSSFDLLLDCSVDVDGDGDGVDAGQDSDDNDQFVCSDVDGDSCDDCVGGSYDPSADGPDADGDGQCDASDPLVVCTGDFAVDATDTTADLTALAGCQEVTGDLDVTGTTLTDLAGLSSIITVGGRLFIWNNAALTQVDGLADLTSVVGNLILDNNDALTQIDGLADLTSVGGGLTIWGHENLTQIDGLVALTSVGADMVIGNNDVLAQIGGLSALTSVGGAVTITGNPVLCQAANAPPVSLWTVGAGTTVNNNDANCP